MKLAIIIFFLILFTSRIGISSEQIIVRHLAMYDYIEKALPCQQIFEYIKLYSEKYNIPERLMFKVAKLETNYDGPNDFYYIPNQISSVNAYGPMQILLSTANDINTRIERIVYRKITREDLLYDIELNIHLSAIYLRNLYNSYGSWKIACGYYNSGFPITNQYAIVATS